MAGCVKTTCPYCGTGCGVEVTPSAGSEWTVKGDPDHPANGGRLCSKGSALADTLGLETRLLTPQVDGSTSDWPTAIAAVADRIRRTIAEHGPNSFAFYLSGQLLTEDYYAANKLAKGFLGTANVDTNSRLCMASTVAGHRRAFGSDTVPGSYDDLELADLVVLVGSNLAWCHPVLFQRLRAAKTERGTKVVVIDPRRTDSCDIADLHLALKPGTDVALFNGLLAHCVRSKIFDREYVDRHVTGFDQAVAQDLRLSEVAALCDVPMGDLVTFFGWFSQTPKTVTVFSQGINQSSAGTDKVNAILNVHLATGRIGKEGASPFSVTGQPNAMGGREVGGLANQLAAHMGFDAASVDRVGRFWNAPNMAKTEGAKAVEMFRALDAGTIKAVWIMGTNPAVSLPDADMVRRALAKCPTVIVSDCVAQNDTLAFAHIKLPALGWGEKDGTVTNSDRTISRQRAFMAPSGQAKPDWWAVAQVAGALGFGADFAWQSPAEIFREHAALSGFENQGSRDFDISDKVGADYQRMQPFQWGGKRLFADGGFFTPDAKARMIAVDYRPPVDTVNSDFPFRLNTGRYRDQWHTMTRTGLSAKLNGHRPEPLIEIHPDDALDTGLADGDLAQVRTAIGGYTARVQITDAQRPGDLFIPMHWNDCFASDAVVGRVIAPHVDSVSGQPESKHVPARIVPLNPAWYGLLVSRSGVEITDAAHWWTRRQADGAVVTELAGDGSFTTIIDQLNGQFGSQCLEMRDQARAIARLAWVQDGRLQAVLYLSPHRPDIASSWVAGLVGGDLDQPGLRQAVLAGTSPHNENAPGPIVCACFSVGLNTITQAIRTQRLVSAAQIGAALKAGTGCGSCIPELNRLLSHKESTHELQRV